jgi:lysophospholipase L1-like esterase
VLAFGDSITNGNGPQQWGVAHQSWALWVARSLGLPFTCHAVDGAMASDIVASQIPTFHRLAADPHSRYELGCLFIGTNDVRSSAWDAATFSEDFARALEFLQVRCDVIVTLTCSLDLGRPPAGPKVATMNMIIRERAAEFGAVVVEPKGLVGRRLRLADRVHPTAMGQIHIAECVLDALVSHDIHPKGRPADFAHPRAGSRARAIDIAHYALENVIAGAVSVAKTRARGRWRRPDRGPRDHG